MQAHYFLMHLRESDAVDVDHKWLAQLVVAQCAVTFLTASAYVFRSIL